MNAIATALVINGSRYSWSLPAHFTLLDALRDEVQLTGTKRGCEIGACGSCNVLVNGRLVRSCLTLAADVDGSELTTIEGLGKGLNPGVVQQAFVETNAIQCGFCMSGMMIAAAALLERNGDPSVDEIRAGIAGTLCRCSGYVKVVEAVLLAAARFREKRP